MRRIFAILLVAVLMFCLCACGGTPAPTTAPTTEPTTEATTEPIPNITVYAIIPEGWSDPACWSWQDGGSDAFESWPGEAMRSGNGWYSVEVPGWIDRVIINGNGGSVQTADLSVEAGRDVWVHVVNGDYAFVHYEEPTGEQLEEERDQPALDYHQAFFRGGYQITGTKAVAFNQGTGRYCTDYVPEELLAETTEEAFYVVYIVNVSQFKGYYFFPGEMRSAIQPGVRIEIRELASDKVLKSSEDFMGGEPPETISWEQSGRGTEPDQNQIRAWVETALAEVMQSTPTELPYIPLNEEALTEEEKAAAEAKELAERLFLSYERLVDWLVEYEGYTQEAAETAAANCGVDFKEMALLNAQEILFEKSDLYPSAQSRDGLIDWLVNIDQFTQEEAVYAADNCGADWNEQKLIAAQALLDGQADSVNGYYSHAGLVYELVEDHGFTKEEATAFADNCGIDWMQNAKLEAQRVVDDELGVGYSELELDAFLRDDPSNYGKGFTSEETAYAMKNVKADWAKEAAKRAAFLIEYTGLVYTKETMIDELVRYYGFTVADATYGAEQNGLT